MSKKNKCKCDCASTLPLAPIMAEDYFSVEVSSVGLRSKIEGIASDPTWNYLLLQFKGQLNALGYFWDDEVEGMWRDLINLRDELY